MGRVGTIIIAVAIALAMLSLIPARAEQNTDFGATSILQPKTFSIESQFFLTLIFDPQRGLYLNMQANRSVTYYLLTTNKEYVYQWITDHFSENQTADTSALDNFLEDNRNSVVRQGVVGNEIEFQYAPTKLTNITLIFSNPDSETAKVRYNGKLMTFIVPSERAINAAKYATPLGIAFTLPQLISAWKRKKSPTK
jgi:hypothetical protein